MRLLHLRLRLLVPAALLVALGVLLTTPRWAAATIARLRFPGPVAVADSFVRAAVVGDTTRLRRLAADSVPVKRLLGMRQAAPAGFAAAVRARRLVSAGHVSGRADVGVDFALPTRSMPGYCYVADGTDRLQVALVPVAGGWKVRYAGLEPC